MQKFRLTILLIICSNGLAYAQTFNETPILPFMPQKEMKFPKISGLPDIKSTLSETNPVFSNSLPLAKQYEEKDSPIWILSSPVISIKSNTGCSIPIISDMNYTAPVIHSGE